MKVAESILELIGETPLIKINKLNPNEKVEIYAKLEGMNPGGSVKDRICLEMILEAERKGYLSREKTIIEATSGNTGIGLAMVAAFKGYKCLLVMPASVSMERILLLKAFGANVILTPPREGVDGAIRKVLEILKEDSGKEINLSELRGPVLTKNYFMPNQFSNPVNPRTHYESTAKEIWIQTNGRVTHFVAGLGTGGTITGVGRYLKERNPEIRVIGVEPEPNHKIQGLRSMCKSMKPTVFDESILDEKIMVSTEVAYEWALKVTRLEGLFVGQSSGAAMYAACMVAKEISEGVIVTVFPDFGFKYLFTDPYFKGEVVGKARKAKLSGETIEL